MEKQRSKATAIKKALVGAGVPLFLTAAAVLLYTVRVPLACPSYLLLHIYCPGCGSGRAAYSLIHGHLADAFKYNPFFVTVLPFIMYYILYAYLKYVFGVKRLPMFNPGKKTILTVIVILLAFFVFRNIPVYPFTLLAP